MDKQSASSSNILLVSKYDSNCKCEISQNAIKMSQTLSDMLSDMKDLHLDNDRFELECKTQKNIFELEIDCNPLFLKMIVQYCEYHSKPGKDMPLTPEYTINYSPDDEHCPDPNCDRLKCNYILDAFQQGKINEFSTFNEVKEFCPFEECFEEFRVSFIKNWDKNFIKEFVDIDDQEKKKTVLLLFIKDASYLNIKTLVELIAKELAKLLEIEITPILNENVSSDIKVNNAKKFIRNYFNIPNDWDPAEEKNVTDKFLWIYDIEDS